MKKLAISALSLVIGLTAIATVLTAYIPQAIAAGIVPRTITVCKTGGCDYTTIQGAVNNANSGDVIMVSAGTYQENITFAGAANTITVTSTNPDDSTVVQHTIIDGRRSGSVVTFSNGTGQQLRGFTITDGRSTYGGGIYCSSSSPTIANCIITGNTATDSYAGGGGIFCLSSCTPTITKCTISGNTANNGGGIYCYGSCSLMVTNCDITGNTAQGAGGGGIYIGRLCIVQAINCTITKNTSLAYGGGIFANSEGGYPIKITNCTFSMNSSNPSVENKIGGGIYCNAINGETIITNCIFYNDINGEINYSSGRRPTVSYSAVTGGFSDTDGNMTLTADTPLFKDPAQGDYRLLPGSPCIDKGTNTVALTDDKNGILRPQDGDNNGVAVSDMGAYEYLSGSPTLITLDQFSAAAQGNHLVITWTTSSEEDTAGFNLWRAQAEGGEYIKINPAIIEPEDGSISRHEYFYSDDTASPGVEYYYQLEEIDNSGVSTFYGPVSPAIQSSSDRPVDDYALGYEQLESLQSLLWLSISQYPGVQYPGVQYSGIQYPGTQFSGDYFSFYSQLCRYLLR